MRYTLAALTIVATLGGAQAAGFDCTKFEHQPDGSWKVVQAIEIRGPRGRIDFTPDETYKAGQEKMGLDLAKLLDANCSKK